MTNLIEGDDSYEEMAATFQVIEIARLSRVLEEHNVPLELRRAVCESYFFENGVFLDAGWLKAGDRKVFPTLCFAERNVDPEAGLGPIDQLILPSDFFSFHEYAMGDVMAYFDENGESLDSIEHGNL